MGMPVQIQGKNKNGLKVQCFGSLVYQKGGVALVLTALHAIREMRGTIQVFIQGRPYWVHKQTFLYETNADLALLSVEIDLIDVEQMTLAQTLCDVPLAKGSQIFICIGFLPDGSPILQKGEVLNPTYRDGDGKVYIKTTLKAWRGLSGTGISRMGENRIAAVMTSLHPENQRGFAKPIGNLIPLLSKIFHKPHTFYRNTHVLEVPSDILWDEQKLWRMPIKTSAQVDALLKVALLKLEQGDYQFAQEAAEAIYDEWIGSGDELDPQYEWKVIEALLTLLTACPMLIPNSWQIQMVVRLIRLRIEWLRKIRDFALNGEEPSVFDFIIYYAPQNMPEFSLLKGTDKERAHLNGHTQREAKKVNLSLLWEGAKELMFTNLMEVLTRANDYPDRAEAAFMIGRIRHLLQTADCHRAVKCALDTMCRHRGFGWFWGDWQRTRIFHHYDVYFEHLNLQGPLEECVRSSDTEPIIRFGQNIIANPVLPQIIEEGCRVIYSECGKGTENYCFHLLCYGMLEVIALLNNRIHLNRGDIRFGAFGEMLRLALDCPWTAPKLLVPYALGSLLPYLEESEQSQAKEMLQDVRQIVQKWDDSTREILRSLLLARAWDDQTRKLLQSIQPI